MHTLLCFSIYKNNAYLLKIETGQIYTPESKVLLKSPTTLSCLLYVLFFYA